MGYYSSGWSLVLIGLAEAVVFPWVYGAKRLKKDIEYMVGFTIGPHWWFCWTFITPTLLIVSRHVLYGISLCHINPNASFNNYTANLIVTLSLFIGNFDLQSNRFHSFVLRRLRIAYMGTSARMDDGNCFCCHDPYFRFISHIEFL